MKVLLFYVGIGLMFVLMGIGCGSCVSMMRGQPIIVIEHRSR